MPLTAPRRCCRPTGRPSFAAASRSTARSRWRARATSTRRGSSAARASCCLRPASSTNSAWRPHLEGLVIAAVATAALAALIAFLLARAIARPVRRVAEATRGLASSTSEPPLVPVEGARELALLAESFNEVAVALAKAREAERAFLLSVSHELKTPLTAIRGYAEGLGEGVLPAEEAASTILRESRRLERLVGDLLDLGRMNKAEFSVRREPIDLRGDRAGGTAPIREPGARVRRHARSRRGGRARDRRRRPDAADRLEPRRERAADDAGGRLGPDRDGAGIDPGRGHRPGASARGARAGLRPLLPLLPLRPRAPGRDGARARDRQGARAGDGRQRLRREHARRLTVFTVRLPTTPRPQPLARPPPRV